MGLDFPICACSVASVSVVNVNFCCCLQSHLFPIFSEQKRQTIQGSHESANYGVGPRAVAASMHCPTTVSCTPPAAGRPFGVFRNRRVVLGVLGLAWLVTQHIACEGRHGLVAVDIRE